MADQSSLLEELKPSPPGADKVTATKFEPASLREYALKSQRDSSRVTQPQKMEPPANYTSWKPAEAQTRPQRLAGQRTTEAFNLMESFIDDYNAQRLLSPAGGGKRDERARGREEHARKVPLRQLEMKLF